jgi:hypothetical protein
MAVTTTNNKPLNPRGNDQSPKGYNRAALYSGKALDFDGVNDYVDIDSFSMSGQNATFAFHLKADNWWNSTLIFDFKTKRFAIGVNPANNLAVYSYSAWHTFGEFSNTTDTNFVVITIEGTTAKAYINGQHFGTDGTIATIDMSTASEAKLMSRFSADNQFFNGKLSGFKIFNTALTAAQVADLYNNPEKVVPTGVADSALKLWLPMQEGAGTTAYDGSGNGNHGTISGATWTHGIGAPVAQTAVIDWNKELNLAPYSEDFTQSAYSKTGVVLTANDVVSPNGLTTGTKVAMNQDAESGVKLFTPMNAGAYTMKYFAKAGTITNAKFYQIEQGVAVRYMDIDLANGTISNVPSAWDSASIKDAGNGWYLISVTNTMDAYHSGHGYGLVVSNENGNYFYLWGFHHKESATLESYVPNFTASSLTSEVLLPQGLTTGRDITGVNLFENVRKQGALNLDGNSWAEVHDNASLDITDAITLEAWVYWDSSVSNAVLGKWDYSISKASYLIYKQSATNFRFFLSYNGTSVGLVTNSTTISNGWNHLVGVYDGVNIKCYLNGSEDGSLPYGLGIFETDLPVQIGKIESTTSPYAIAQPRIYNRALTAEEVERNYNAGKNIYK